MKALLFDLEGTLVESSYQQSPETIEGLRRETRQKLVSLGVPVELLAGLVRSYALRNVAYQWAEDNLSVEQVAWLRAEMEAFMAPYDMVSARRTVLYPDTLSALNRLLDEGVAMGVVTNTSAAAAEYILTNLGLRSFFGAVATRSDVPRLKPDPAIIYLAESRLGVEVGWLVGDASFDSEAARNAGLISIILGRDGRRPDFDHDFFIRSLEEAPSIIFRHS